MGGHHAVFAPELRRHFQVLWRWRWTIHRSHEYRTISTDSDWRGAGIDRRSNPPARRWRHSVYVVVWKSGVESQSMGFRRFRPGRLEAAAQFHSESWSALREPAKHRQQF